MPGLVGESGGCFVRKDVPRFGASVLEGGVAGHVGHQMFAGGLELVADQAAKEDPVATVNRRIPEERKSNEAILPGTRLVRVWNDRRYEVIVLADGYEFEGRTFRSLSAVAREITGTRWNGKVFFGLKKVYGRKAEGGSDA